MQTRTIRLLALACATTFAAHSGMAQTFGISIGVREGTASTTIGAASAANASIEWVNAAGVPILADGLYHTVTFNLGTDPTTYFAGTAGSGQTNNVLDGAFVGLEHLRIVNSSGSTLPISIFIDDIVSTPSGGSPTTLTDFQTVPTAIANNTSNVLFREPSISGSTTANFARNPTLSSTVVDLQPDGTNDPNLQAARLNMRFNTPEVVTSSTGWGRAICSSTNSAIPSNPTIAGVGSTLTMRVAIVVNTPQYGYVGYDGVSGNNNWNDDANWGKGPNAGTINHPNSTSATALFDETVAQGDPITPRTVLVNAPISVQNLQFTTVVPYTLDGVDTLTVTRASDLIVPTINVEAGSHTINAPVAFASNPLTPPATGSLSYAPTIWVSSGASLTLSQAPTVNRYQLTATGSPVNSLTKRGAGVVSMPDVDVDTLTVVKGAVNLAPTASSTIATVSLGSTVIPNAGGKVAISPASGVVKTITTLSIPASNTATVGGDHTGAGGDVVFTTVNVGANSNLKIDLAGSQSMKVTTLTLNGAATPTPVVDLTNDGIILDYSSTATPDLIRTQILSAYAGGAWSGKGISSSLLPAASNYAIGYAILANGAAFLGHTAGDDSTMGIAYVRKGDHDLDKDVDFDDLLLLAQNYDAAYDPIANGPKLWNQGDFNYDGIVNFDDLLALAQNYGSTSLSEQQVASLGSEFASDWRLALSVVPEPTSLSVLGGLAVALRRRR